MGAVGRGGWGEGMGPPWGQHTCTSGCDHSNDPDVESGVGGNLWKFVDREHVRALNAWPRDGEAGTSAGDAVFKPWEERLARSPCLASDPDDSEVILHVPFTCQVSIKAVTVVGGPDGSSPASLRCFVGREALGFTDAQDQEATQEWPLTENFDAAVELPTRVRAFRGVSHVALHFPASLGADDTVLTYVGFRGEWAGNKQGAPGTIVYEARANPKDHKVEGGTNFAGSTLGF